MIDTPADADALSSSTEEIPSSAPGAPWYRPKAPAPNAVAGEESDPELARYQREQSGIDNSQQLQNLSEFMSDGEITSPIGIGLREARRKLASGPELDGLLVVDVTSGSPAAGAGLHAYSHRAKDVMSVLVMAGAMAVMPPAVLLLPVIDAVPVGETYDLIIGVDGNRVRNFIDFEDRMQRLKPGQTVYLSVLRNGTRLQFAIPVPKHVALDTH